MSIYPSWIAIETGGGGSIVYVEALDFELDDRQISIETTTAPELELFDGGIELELEL